MNFIKVLIDIIIVAIIAFSIWRGYKGGIIATVCATVALFVSLIAGNVVATVYASEFEGALSTFAGGIVDTAASETLDFKGYDEDGQPDDRYPILTEEEKRDVHTVSLNVLRRVGVSDDVANDIAEETAGEVDTVGLTMRQTITAKLCGKVSFAAVFFVVFLLVVIIFAAIGNIVNLSFTLPGAQRINSIVGAAIGAFNGIIIVLFITCLFRYTGIIIGKEAVGSTAIASWLTDSNALANIFGI